MLTKVDQTDASAGAMGALILGVERNRKQEFSSFQELLDFVPATFSPSRSAGPLLVLAFCFKYNAT